MERIAPYYRLDGLIERITLYDDYEYMIPTQVYEKYINRMDNLVKSRKDLDSNLVVDSYKRGRPDACKGILLLRKINIDE